MNGQDIAQWIGIGVSVLGWGGGVVTIVRWYGDYREWKTRVELAVARLEKESEKQEQREQRRVDADRERYEKICQTVDKHTP